MANLKYRCLILDHDDTTVDSSATIHYPAFCEAMRILRPSEPVPDLNGFFRKHNDPGFLVYLSDELKLTPEEFKLQFTIWRNFVKERLPLFYPGMLSFLSNYRAQGGIVVVVSHAEVTMIERDYRASGVNFFPDYIFGWHESESKRKPDPYPVITTMEQFKLQPEQLLIVDDLKWGLLMGKATGVATATAGWGHRFPEVVREMRAISDYYLETVAELAELILS